LRKHKNTLPKNNVGKVQKICFLSTRQRLLELTLVVGGFALTTDANSS